MNDNLSLVGLAANMRKVARTRGGEYAGPCPFCGGEDRFRVWPDHPSGSVEWWCRRCGKGGDEVAFRVECGHLTTTEAWRLRHDGARVALPMETVAIVPNRKKRPGPPGPVWQEKARVFVAECKEILWSDRYGGVRGWLHKRGLTDDTIRTAGLGYNNRAREYPRQDWGLDEGKPIWLPRGIVIPWEIGGDLWRVNIRRSKGTPKYIGPAGFKNGLYNADALTRDKPAVLVEGEFDVLALAQCAGDLISPVATGSVTNGRRPAWIGKLALCPEVIVSFDADDAGNKASSWWLDVLDNAHRWRPLWTDASAMAQDGVDLRSWIQAALSPELPLDLPETSREQEPAPWVGARVGIEDLPEFRQKWGLEIVGSRWPSDQPCPTLEFAEVAVVEGGC